MSEFLDTLRADMSVIELATIALSACFAGFLRGFLGFGGALVIILVISVVLSPLSALPIACLSGMPSTLQLLPVAVRLSERAFVLPFGLSSFVAAPLGTWVLVSVQPALMKIVISSMVLILVGMLHRGWRLAPNQGAPALTIAGALTGLVQGGAGMGGPPAVAVALSRTGTSEQQRANVIGAVTALSLCSLIPMWYAGLFTAAVFAQSLAIVPLYSASTWVGARYFSGNGKQHYHGAALLALATMGVITLVISIRGYLVG